MAGGHSPGCIDDRQVTDESGQNVLTFPPSPFVPVVLGFFGLGTGYPIYGPQELLGFPRRDPCVDRANGVWGLWMPGFCQFLVGVYLFVGLTWFPVFTANIAFIVISVLGLTVFFHAGAWPVGLLFTGLTLVYIAEFFACFKIGVKVDADGQETINTGERAPRLGPHRRRPVADVADSRHHLGHRRRIPPARCLSPAPPIESWRDRLVIGRGGRLCASWGRRARIRWIARSPRGWRPAQATSRAARYGWRRVVEAVDEGARRLSRGVQLHDPSPGSRRLTKTAANRDDGRNDMLMGDVPRTRELQVWFGAEHLMDLPAVRI